MRNLFIVLGLDRRVCSVVCSELRSYARIQIMQVLFLFLDRRRKYSLPYSSQTITSTVTYITPTFALYKPLLLIIMLSIFIK